MTFKVLALVVEQFLARLLNFVLKKFLFSKCEIFTPICYKYIQVTACKNWHTRPQLD